jgi:hypothetical protein
VLGLLLHPLLIGAQGASAIGGMGVPATVTRWCVVVRSKGRKGQDQGRACRISHFL